MNLGTAGLSAAGQNGLLPSIIAAAVVVLMGILNIWVTIRQHRDTRESTRRLTNRELWWQRFTWAAEGLFSDSIGQQRVSATVLATLASVEWANRDDREMIANALDAANRDALLNMAVTSKSPRITNGTIAIARAQKRVLQMDAREVPERVDKIANLPLHSGNSDETGATGNNTSGH